VSGVISIHFYVQWKRTTLCTQCVIRCSLNSVNIWSSPAVTAFNSIL